MRDLAPDAQAALAVEGCVMDDASSTIEGWSAVCEDETAVRGIDPPAES